MSENIYKKPESTEKNEKGKSHGSLHGIIDGSILQGKGIVSLIPFFFFLTFLALILIFNTYYAEKKARRIESLRIEVVELHLKYISVKSDLMYITNQSEVYRKLKNKGFVESVVPPMVVKKPQKSRSVFSRFFLNNIEQ